MANNNWKASDYRKRKAERQELIEPEWVTNPETNESFYLRRVGAMALLVAGQMPASLTAEAVKAWEQEGVEGAEANAQVKQPTDEGQRDTKLIARVVSQACVIPKLVDGATAEDELDPAELDDKDLLFIFRWATGQVGSVPMKGGETMNVADLKSVRKKPRRSAGAGDDGSKLQQVS